MKNFFTLFLLVIASGSIFSQSYQGPAAGHLESGIIQSTETLGKIAPNTKPFLYESPEVKQSPTYLNFGKTTLPEGSNYVQDAGVLKSNLIDHDTLLASWDGLAMDNVIPPDPTMAVGPSHVVACVNTNFSIWDKSGKLLRTISGNTWVAKSVNNADVVTDPKVVYDHFSKRWIMVWMTVNTTAQTSYWVISVSQDSIPIGNWYTWATPSNVNGTSTVSNYSDYQGVGFDKDAIYICGNQFSFSGSFQYSKFRIYPKAQLLNNTPNEITWTDFWDIRVPGLNNTQTFGIRPTISFSENSEAYLVWTNSNGGNFFSLYAVQNPLSATPTIAGLNIPITAFTRAPNAYQLGGIKQYTIETNSSRLTNEPVYRDGYLWITHSVKNPTDSTSAIHYLKFDVTTATAVEDVVYGSAGYWYCYPTVMVDKEQNMTIGFSRSGVTDYIGAYYACKKTTDASLGASKTLQSGKGNYEVVYSGTRNRWGDYMGIALDPVDEHSVWMHTEYASATNQWATYIGQVLAKPIEGTYLSTSTPNVNTGQAPVGSKGDTVIVTLKNLGTQDVIINSIPSVGPFKIVNNFTFPITLGTFDSVAVFISYEPSVKGTNEEFLPISSNASNFSGLSLKGFSFILATAEANSMYASTGSTQNGQLFKVSPASGATSLIGSTTLSEVKSISIDPKTNVIYGIAAITGGTNVLGIDAATGQAYRLFSLPIADTKSMAFDTAGTLYFATRLGQIYTLNIATRKYAPVCSVKTPLISLAFDPKNNNLFGVSSTVIGVKDKLFRINLANGDTINVAKTGTGLNSNGIAFDNSGKLYAATGAISVSNDLYQVDTLISKSTLIGSTGIKNITDLAFSSSPISGVQENVINLPKEFVLSQNYPNPFNPNTIIEYSLPQSANVKIIVYNVLGQKIKELVNLFKEAGSYKVNWDASGFTSGIYFYEMKASTPEGKEFSSFKKMILVK